MVPALTSADGEEFVYIIKNMNHLSALDSKLKGNSIESGLFCMSHLYAQYKQMLNDYMKSDYMLMLILYIIKVLKYYYTC